MWQGTTIRHCSCSLSCKINHISPNWHPQEGHNFLDITWQNLESVRLKKTVDSVVTDQKVIKIDTHVEVFQLEWEI